MRRGVLLLTAIGALAQMVPAATRLDSILAVTQNIRARFVWVRYPWCADNYYPNQAYAVDQGQRYEQDHQFTQLMGYDTDEGKYQFIDSTVGYHCFPRITRRNGNYVVWNDPGDSCSWIRDIARTTPRKVFLSHRDYWVLAFQYNPVTDTEYVYVFTSYYVPSGVFPQLMGKGVERMPLKADNMPDTTKKKVILTTATTVMHTVSVSQDGKYMGCNVPLPNCRILDIATGALIVRKDPTAEFGCQTNIAPNNSYRFFHLMDDHLSVAMFDSGVAATVKMWSTPIMSAVPGPISYLDNCLDPRWANDVRFLTFSYPLETGLGGTSSNIFWDTTKDSAWMRAQDPTRAGTFCVGRFNATFTALDKAVQVSDGDVRHREGVGDGWFGATASAVAPRRLASAAGKHAVFALNGHGIFVNEPSAVTITDAAGRSLRSARVSGAGRIDFRGLPRGALFVRAEISYGAAVNMAVVNQ